MYRIWDRWKHMLQYIRISLAVLAFVLSPPLSGGADAQEAEAQRSFMAGSNALTSGDIARAEQLFRLSIQQLRGAPSSAQWLAAYPLSALANIELQRGNQSDALELAIASEQASLSSPRPHPESRLLGMNIRAVILSARLDPSADDVWNEAVDIARSITRPEDPESIYTTLNNYAEYLKDTGRAEEAVQLHAYILEQRKSVGITHAFSERFIAISRLNLAVARYDAGDEKTAELEIKDLLSDLSTSSFPGKTDVYGMAGSNLSQILIPQKRLDEAYGFALDGLRQFQSPTDPAGLIPANSLAMILHMQGEQATGNAMFEEIYKKRLAFAWSDHPSAPKIGIEDEDFLSTGLLSQDLLIGAENFAYSSLLIGDAETAIPIYDGLVHINENLTGADSPVTAKALADAGEARILGGDVATGVKMLERAYAILKADGTYDDFLTITGYRLGAGLMRSGKPDRAVELIEPYSVALTGYSSVIDVTSTNQLQFERFSRRAHEDLLDAAWEADQAGTQR